MIHDRLEHEQRLTVGDREHADLVAEQALLDDQRSARVPEGAFLHHRVLRRHEADGGKRLVTFEPVEPGSAEQVWPIQWPDGIHDLSYVWYTEGDYLSDGTTGDFVLLWQIEPGRDLKTINGRFRQLEDSVYRDSVLMVDTSTGRASELLDTKTGEVIVPGPGDQFQIMDLFLDESGSTITASGANLTFGELAHLESERRTLPQGDYFLGFITEGGAGNGDSVFANFMVSNENLLPLLDVVGR